MSAHGAKLVDGRRLSTKEKIGRWEWRGSDWRVPNAQTPTDFANTIEIPLRFHLTRPGEPGTEGGNNDETRKHLLKHLRIAITLAHNAVVVVYGHGWGIAGSDFRECLMASARHGLVEHGRIVTWGEVSTTLARIGHSGNRPHLCELKNPPHINESTSGVPGVWYSRRAPLLIDILDSASPLPPRILMGHTYLSDRRPTLLTYIFDVLNWDDLK